MKYVLEAFRANQEFDTFTTFNKLSEAKAAMTELSQSEGRTLAFIRLPGSEGAVIATRDWYASAKWLPIDRKTYEELIDMVERYRNSNVQQQVAA